MRNEDLRQVDECLQQWGDWMREHSQNLGYPRETAEHRMMILGIHGAAIRNKASAISGINMPDVVEKMETAILALPTKEYIDIVKAKYLCGGTDKDRAERLSVVWSQPLKLRTFRSMLERAMYWLSGHLTLIEKSSNEAF